jgi:hypothetical protein
VITIKALLERAVTSLTTSIKHFASLNRAPGATLTDATKRKTPQKPLLLLVLDELFNHYWRLIISQHGYKQFK